MKDIRKYIKDYSVHSNMTQSELIELETLSLERLNKGYECKCNGSRNHFPILRYSDNNSIVMTSCGPSLNTIKNFKAPKDIIEQINCILSTLEKAKIRHVDCPYNGQNLCYDEQTDTLAIIDFDMAFLEGENENKTIERWSQAYGNSREDYSRKYREKIIKIIRNKEIKKMGMFNTLFGETGGDVKGGKGKKGDANNFTYKEKGNKGEKPKTNNRPPPSQNKNMPGNKKQVSIKENESDRKIYSFMDPDSLQELNILNRRMVVGKK